MKTTEKVDLPEGGEAIVVRRREIYQQRTLGDKIQRAALLGLLGLGAATLLRAAIRGVADLRGQVVLIAGGSRGLGLMLARQFAAAGCRIAVCARDEKELKSARAELQKSGLEIFTVPCDVTDVEQVQAMVEAVRAHYGRIDILVNAAAVIHVGPYHSMTRQDFEDAMDAGFWGTVNTTEAVVPEMRERGYGRIVNIASIAGRVSIPHLLPYNCAKWAVLGFSQGLHGELKRDGITVTTIVPGLMRTGSQVQAWVKGNIKAEWAMFGIAGSLPGFSIRAEDAAREIVDATRRGEAERIIGTPFVWAARLAGFFPNATGDVLALIGRFLPGGDGTPSGKVRGKDAREKLDSPLVDRIMQPNIEAGHRLNEYSGSHMNGHAAEEAQES